MRRSTTIGTLLAAAVVGIGLGVLAFVSYPLPFASDESEPSTPPRSTAGSEDAGPPFTRAALLLPSELTGFGWGKADQPDVYEGVPAKLRLLCLSTPSITEDAVEGYASTYLGAQTKGVEVVTRYRSAAAAGRTLRGLADQADQCADTDEGQPATVNGTNHPQLSRVDRTIYWRTRSNTTEARQPQWGVLAVSRVDDRLTTLSLTSPTSDPALTVQLEPLLTQAARRLV